MTKLYNKNKLVFALVWIVIYVVLASTADRLSENIGISKIITAPLLICMSAVIYRWVFRSGLAGEYGLVLAIDKKSGTLYYIPLAVLITVNLWNGITLNMPIIDTVFYVISMVFVGFLEEVIFRGFLFKSICESGLKKAFIISSVTFGIGHIVNLLNGSELLPTILQIISAIVIGFLFTLVFYKTQSLWMCIITHSIFNSSSAFAVEQSKISKIASCVAICTICIAYSIYLIYRNKEWNEQ